MLPALHRTLENLLKRGAPDGSLLRQDTTTVDFSVPDSTFRAQREGVTLNLYLYSLRENLEMRRADTLLHRHANGTGVARVRAPALLDCGYCITAWSGSLAEPVFEEHQALGEVVQLLLSHRRIDRKYWHEDFRSPMAPYPTVVAQPDGIQNQAEMWTALGHPPKPILSYVVTIAIPVHDENTTGVPVGGEEDSLDIVQVNGRPSAASQ